MLLLREVTLLSRTADVEVSPVGRPSAARPVAALERVLHSSGSLLTGVQVAPPMCARYAGVRVQAFCRPHLGPPGLLPLGFTAAVEWRWGGTESSPCLPLTRRMWARGSCCFLRVAPLFVFPLPASSAAGKASQWHS
ncbi:hypothetical protein MTO96_035939 [Rhipicephalus appendiculatus]